MKFQVTMKDPDTLSDAIDEAVKKSTQELETLDDEERESIAAVRRTKFKNMAQAWFKWGEYLTVEIDTDAGTCTVVPCS